MSLCVLCLYSLSAVAHSGPWHMQQSVTVLGGVDRMLLEGRADADKARTDNGFTPMLIAAQDGHDAIVR